MNPIRIDYNDNLGRKIVVNTHNAWRIPPGALVRTNPDFFMKVERDMEWAKLSDLRRAHDQQFDDLIAKMTRVAEEQKAAL